MKAQPVYIAFLLLLFGSCTGTDYVDDLQIGQKIEIENTQVALKPGENVQLAAMYYDDYGIKKEVMLQFSSSDTRVAEVDSTGKITAHIAGSSVVEVSYNGVAGPLVNVNVVAGVNDVAIVEVTAPVSSLNPGEKTQLALSVENINMEGLSGRQVEWFSENESILTVNATGEVTAVTAGVAAVHAKVDGVKSNSVNITVGSLRTGTFVKAGGYQAKGTASMGIENGKLILKLSEDFETSFALGTYIYLANTTNGKTVRSAGLEISEINTNGAKSFDISALYPDVKIYDYRYVIILCKPATVTFGYADLN